MKQEHKEFIPYIVASIVMFISMFFGMKMAGLGLLIWILTFVMLIRKTLFLNKKPVDFLEANNKIIDESIESGKYVKSSVHLIAMPMVILGLLWVIITIFMMIFIL